MITGTLRTTALSLLAPVLIAAASSVRIPVIPVCNRTALYLLAQYKVAIGDTRSAVDLLSRAAASANPNHLNGPACPARQIHART